VSPSVSSSATTPNGLPRRTPQAHLAAPLRASAPRPPDDDDAGSPVPAVSPEEIAATFASYQRGTQAGRDEAARQLEEHTE
jgi:hypothetical protein